MVRLLSRSEKLAKMIPIGTYYYPIFSRKKIKPFILAPIYARWITKNPRDDFADLDQAAYEKLFEAGAFNFADNLGNDPSIEAFVSGGGKLIMDHGMDDPLIPVQGTMDYYDKLCDHFGGKANVDKFCRFYRTPGDNHGHCRGNGPGLTESSGIAALMDWVEKGIAPGALRKVRVHPKTGVLLEEGMEEPV